MPSIGELCRDPVETRARAAAGEQVPCYRCIAWHNEKCELMHAARWARGLNGIVGTHSGLIDVQSGQTTLFKESDDE